MSHTPQYLTEAEISSITDIALSTLRNQRDVIDYMESRRIDTEEVHTIRRKRNKSSLKEETECLVEVT